MYSEIKRKLVCAGLLSAVLAMPAFAADLDIESNPVAGYDWTGAYIGGHIGYGWGHKDWTLVSGNHEDHSIDGFLGGLQAGYDWQLDNWVFGVEGEISWTHIDGGTDWFSTGNNAGPRDISAEMNWIGSVSARGGIAVDRTLFFAKAGYAWADEDFSHLSANGVRTGSETRKGWLIGGGIEHAFSNEWSAKIEYSHIDFGSDGVTMKVGGAQDRTLGLEQTLGVLKIGMNYRF